MDTGQQQPDLHGTVDGVFFTYLFLDFWTLVDKNYSFFFLLRKKKKM